MNRRIQCFLIGCLLCALRPVWGQAPEEREFAPIAADQLLEQAKVAFSEKEQKSLAMESLAESKRAEHKGGIVRASVFLGEQSARLGKSREALEYFLEAEFYLREVPNPVTQRMVYNALGDLFMKEKLFSVARRYQRLSLALKPDDESLREKMGDAYLREALFDSALVCYQPLLDIAQNQGKWTRLVQLYQKIANAYDGHGDPKKSLEYYRMVENWIENLGSIQDRSLLYNNLGRQYTLIKDFPNALKYLRKAELQCSYIPCEYPEVMYANLGIALHNTSNSKEGLMYMMQARNILLDKKDNKSLANLEHLIANVRLNNNDVYGAITHNDDAIRLAKVTRQRPVLASAYRTAADIYHELYDFEKAYDYYKKYLNMADSIRSEEASRLERFEQQRSLLASAEGQIKYLITSQNFKDLQLTQAQSDRKNLELLNKNLELEKGRQEDELRLLQNQKSLDEAELRRKSLENLRVQQELRIAAQQLRAEQQGRVAEQQNRLIADLRQQEEAERSQRIADSTRRAQETEILNLRIEQQTAFERFAYGLGSLLFLLLCLLAVGWILAQRASRRLKIQNSQIEAQKRLIEAERIKSDKLLLNILPDEIAQELRTQGHAYPKHYESATVLFTDFVNFTSLAAHLSPDALLTELDECFLAFDEIAERHNLEKIKTIGDAYMCVGGIPVANKTHPVDAVRAALDMVAWLQHRNDTNPNAVFKEMRVGIHTGQVTAGVIGKNKFAYDIWGDAVNLASRMEEEGISNRINISGATYAAIQTYFPCEHRGKREVRNKGLVDMYLVT